MPETITVYTLAELKESHPDAFAKVLERWAESVAAGRDVPWADETMDSLRHVVEACGGEMADWSIGAYSHSRLNVTGIDDEEQGRTWFLREVLKPHGYTRKNGHAYFPGNCAFTGYCADDLFLERTWQGLNEGRTLTEALEDLADVAREVMEDAIEQQQGEEFMMANWKVRRFTEDGTEV